MKNVCDGVWSRGLFQTTALATASLLCWLPVSANDSGSEASEEEEEVFELSPFEVSAGSGGGFRAVSRLAGSVRAKIGATVGGAQDIRFTRDFVKRNLVPPSESFTPEGLFSEHDLPIPGKAPEGWLFDIVAQTTAFNSPAQPEVQALTQLGFATGLDATTLKPNPLNLVAVVDKSGSMMGEPIELVKASLRQIASQLGDRDQLSIVLFGSETYTFLQPTTVSENGRHEILTAIDRIESSGSTAMEAGLTLGYQVARKSAKSFRGTTRVMLFTDEQPNVGRTDPESFMGLARAASEDGIGLTTIGVGVHFGSELATEISSVRGGNLFFFQDASSMDETFRKELDTMVLELAYDLELRVTPAEGFSITGLYGIPGDVMEWNTDGSVTMEISTIFASRKNGAIYLGFGSIDRGPIVLESGVPLAHASIIYTQADNGEIRQSQIEIAPTSPDKCSEGIIKGTYLVDHYASLKLATLLYEKRKYREAARVMTNFAQRSPPLQEPGLKRERDLARDLSEILVADCRKRGLKLEESTMSDAQSRILGEWIESPHGLSAADREILRFSEDSIELYTTSSSKPLKFLDESKYSLKWRYLVFEDWGQSFRYKIRDDELLLKDGSNVTSYRKRFSSYDPTDPFIEELVRKISGLPQRAAESIASSD